MAELSRGNHFAIFHPTAEAQYLDGIAKQQLRSSLLVFLAGSAGERPTMNLMAQL